jgi:enoyl-CoA hydratase
MTRVAELVGENADPFVILDRDHVRIIVMNRPAARNALTRQMRRDFPAIIEAADHDDAVSVLILTGMDPAFSAGVDLKERASGALAPVRPNPGEVLRGAHKPIIAAVNGSCVTGALEMALSCSFIIASTKARFADSGCWIDAWKWRRVSRQPTQCPSQHKIKR